LCVLSRPGVIRTFNVLWSLYCLGMHWTRSSIIVPAGAGPPAGTLRPGLREPTMRTIFSPPVARASPGRHRLITQASGPNSAEQAPQGPVEPIGDAAPVGTEGSGPNSTDRGRPADNKRPRRHGRRRRPAGHELDRGERARRDGTAAAGRY